MLTSIKRAFMIRVLILLVVSSHVAYSQIQIQIPPFLFRKLQLPSPTIGPKSLAFDITGAGPYTGVADGRILKYGGPNIGFVDFATTSPLRTKGTCDGTSDPNLLAICGRPFSLGFYYRTGELYVSDVNYGLLSVGPRGGLATQLARGFGGAPFAFPDGLDIDQGLGIVYFVDSGVIFRNSGVIYNSSNAGLIIQSGDTSGRLFKYDTRTKQVTLLLSGLSGPTGVSLSKDGSYVLVSEFIAKRIRRFWLKGAKANSSEVFTNLQGHPNLIKRTILGDYWVAVNVVRQQPAPAIFAIANRVGVFGNVVLSLNLTAQFNNSINDVQEQFGRLYVGSLFGNFVGVYGV